MPDATMSIAGNLTRDPELRYTKSGQAICSASVAVNHRFQRNGEWEEEVSFFEVSAWGELGENLAGSCHKGDRVTVTGRPKQRSWEGEGGEKRSAWELMADDVGVSLRWAVVTGVEKTRAPRGSGGPRRPAASGAPFTDEPDSDEDDVF